jgi:CRP-like cAMP-binding protein
MKDLAFEVTHSCAACPLKQWPIFISHSPSELKTVQEQKKKEVVFAAGEELVHEGQTEVPLLTVLDGWAFRFKTTEGGKRQILSFLLPGDLVGIQQNMSEVAGHGVEALTEVRACVFGRNALWELHKQHPTLGFKVTWLTARGEWLVDDSLLSVGRRGAQERVARLLIVLFKRVSALRAASEAALGMDFPLTQQHIADALGMSLVHTHRTLRALEKKGLHQVRDGQLHVHNPTALMKLAELYGSVLPEQRPLV